MQLLRTLPGRCECCDAVARRSSLKGGQEVKCLSVEAFGEVCGNNFKVVHSTSEVSDISKHYTVLLWSSKQ